MRERMDNIEENDKKKQRRMRKGERKMKVK